MVLAESTDSFLLELGKLFQVTKETGTVWITSKRCAYGTLGKTNRRGIVKEGSVPSGEVDHCCLIRATNGKRKVSCIKDVPKFHSAYVNLMTLHMDKLKKKEKKGKDKKAAPKQKKATPVDK